MQLYYSKHSFLLQKQSIMKKIGLFVFAVIAFSFVACNNQKSQGKTSETPMEQASPASSDDSDATAASADSGKEVADSDDPEALIKAYDSYADDVINLMQKAAKGDASAMSEYSTIMQKAQDLSAKLDKVKDKLTPEQTKQLAEIATKMTKAAQGMQK